MYGVLLYVPSKYMLFFCLEMSFLFYLDFNVLCAYEYLSFVLGTRLHTVEQSRHA